MLGSLERRRVAAPHHHVDGAGTDPTTDPDVAAFLVAARPFTVRTPPGYDPAHPAPLLVLLHGFGVTGELEERYLGLADATDAHGMLLVAPDGTPTALGSRFWNATDACCGATSSVDDVAYLGAVIDDVKAHYAVDPPGLSRRPQQRGLHVLPDVL